jgi:hypothetical protein
VNILGNAIGVDQAQKLIEILDASCTLTTLCGFTGEETELDLSMRGLSTPCDATLLSNEAKAGGLLASSIVETSSV